MPLNEHLGDCVWCFQPASGPHRKATMRVWSREWTCYMEVCKQHGEAIERENKNTEINQKEVAQ